jgi:hypothetical protein
MVELGYWLMLRMANSTILSTKNTKGTKKMEIHYVDAAYVFTSPFEKGGLRGIYLKNLP